MSTCGDAAALVADAERAVWELRVEDAEARLAAAEAAFACAAVDPDILARFFVAEAALALHQGDAEGAGVRLRTARELDPAGPDPSYGNKVRAAFDGLPRWPVDATLALEPPPERDEVFVDGRPVTVPFAVSSGLHLVQVGPPGEILFGEVVLVAPEARLVVSTHRDEHAPARPAVAPAVGPAPPPVLAPAAARRGASVPLLVTAGALAALGGAAAGASIAAHGAIPDAVTLEEVDAARRRQVAFGWTAYGLWGGAAVLAGASLF